MKKNFLQVSILITVLAGLLTLSIKPGIQDPLAWKNTFNDQFTDEEIMNELKGSISQDSILQKEYKSVVTVPAGNSRVNDRTTSLIENRVIKKMRRKNMCELYFNFLQIFSRCPSYYTARIIVKNDNIINEGYMLANSGCYEKVVGKFRFDESTLQVEVLVSQRIGYIPVDDYIRLYKIARQNMKIS